MENNWSEIIPDNFYRDDLDDREVMVSIHCLAYNHECYIREALEGFVNQKTNFRFEAIVHDDASTDGTAAIIREYAEKYPSIIKPIYEKVNQYSNPNGHLGSIMQEHMRGKYIAFCEGDDYWIDPFKLQKQFELLESHPNCTLCGSGYIKKSNNKFQVDCISKGELKYFEYDINEWHKGMFSKTLTLMCRTEVLMKADNSKFKFTRDIHNSMHLLHHGKGLYISDVLGVYNIQEGGVWSLQEEKRKCEISYLCWKELYEYYKDDPTKLIYKGALEAYLFNGEVEKSLRKILFKELISYTTSNKVKSILTVKFYMPKSILLLLRKLKSKIIS